MFALMPMSGRPGIYPSATSRGASTTLRNVVKERLHVAALGA